ncbi:MAG: hypothetical protein AB7I09_20200 [Planctomycetota bacterium]
MSARPTPAFLGALLSTLVVLLACAPLRFGHYTADDYDLFQTILSPLEPHAVAWDRVFGEFLHPWSESGDRPFYRPVATLVRALWIDRFGAGTETSHLLNLVLHLCSVFLAAMLAARVRSGSTFLASLTAGTFFGLHAAGVESVAWPSDLPSLLACVSILFAMHVHLGADRSRPSLRRALVVLATLIAVGSKEVGWLMPLFLGVADYLGRTSGGASFRQLVQRQSFLLPWLIGLFCLRWFTVGLLPTERLSELLAPWHQSLLENLPFKALLLVDPSWSTTSFWAGRGGVVHLTYLVCAVALLALGIRRAIRPCMLLGLVSLAAIAPSSANLVGAEWSGSRVLYPGLLPTAWCFSALVTAGLRGSPGQRRLVWGAALVMLGAIGVSHQSRMGAWQRTWEEQREASASLLKIARQTTTTPLVVVNVFEGAQGVPAFLPAFSHLILSRPWSSAEHECLGIPHVLGSDVTTAPVGVSASVIRSLVEADWPLVLWAPGAGYSLLSGESWTPEISAGGAWTADHRLLSPLAFEVVSAECSTPAARWELTLEGGSVERFTGQLPEEAATVHIDVSDEMRVLGLLLGGGVRSLRLRLWSASGAEVEQTRTWLSRRVTELPLRERFEGRSFREFPNVIPSGAQIADRRRVVVLCDSGILVRELGGPTEADEHADTLRWLAARLRSSRWRRLCYFVDAGPGGNSRSRLDWWSLPREAK